MSMRPIDFQTMVPKVSEIARVQGEQQQRNTSLLNQQAEQETRGAETQTTTVHQQETAQKIDLREKREQKRKARKPSYTRLQDKDSAVPNSEEAGPSSGRTIDVKV